MTWALGRTVVPRAGRAPSSHSCGVPLLRRAVPVGEGEVGILEGVLLDAEIRGKDAFAGEDRGDALEDPFAPDDNDLGAAAFDACHSGDVVDEFVGDGAGWREPEPLSRSDAGDESGRRIDRHGGPSVHDHDAIAQPFGLLHEVSHEHDGHSPVPDRFDGFPCRSPRLRIESGGELIEYRDLGVANKGECDRDPLFLSTGQ